MLCIEAPAEPTRAPPFFHRVNPRRGNFVSDCDTAADATIRAISSTVENIAALRKSYERAELSEEASHADPLQQFDQWLTESIKGQLPEPNAMTLATVASDLRPSTRLVRVMAGDDRGTVWCTNYDIRRGQDLAGN